MNKNLQLISTLLETELHSFSLAGEHEAILDKPRLLIKYQKKDELVVKAMGLWIKNKIAPIISTSVQSYLPGRGPQTALKKIRQYVNTHTKVLPLKERGLYVIRRDVKEYTDSIPLHENSPLWSILQRLDLSDTYFSNLQSALRIELSQDQGKTQYNRLFGVPMGSSLTPWIANIYLTDFDKWMEELDPQGLYVRYGDDILWMTPNKNIFEKALNTIDDEIHKLGLSFNAPKSLNLKWSGNGFTKGENLKGSVSIEYLGVRILWNQKIGLTAKKRKKLLKEVRQRIQAVKQNSPEVNLIGETLNDLTKNSWRGSPDMATHLMSVTSPGEWRSIRIDIAREIHRAQFGSVNNYHFRHLSWQEMINRYGWKPKGISFEN